MKKNAIAITALLFLCFAFCNVPAYSSAKTRVGLCAKISAQSPVVNIGNVSGTITTCQGMASVVPNVQQVSISGDQLKSDIYVSPPQGFEVSLSSDNTGYTNSLTIPAVSKSGDMQVPELTLYIRASADAPAGSISGNIIVNSTGTTDQNVAVNGTVYAIPIVNTVNGQTLNSAQASSPINFTGNAPTYNWTNDSPTIGLAANGTGNIPSFIAINNGNNPIAATLSVTPISANGCAGVPVLFNITVNPAIKPGINTSTAMGIITACSGSASQSPSLQQFTVAGKALSGDISASALAGFEVSLNMNTGFASGVTLKQTGGSVSPVTLYVRASATAPSGTISGNVKLSSVGAASVNVGVKAIVKTLPAVTANVPAQTVTNGSATTPINFTGAGNTFTWVNNTPGIGLAANGVGNIDAFTGINTGNIPITATITVSPETPQYAYVANQADGTVSVINIITYKTVTTIKVGSQPTGVSISPDGKLVYVTNTGSNSVSVISTASNSVIATIAVGQSPGGIAVSPDQSKVYVANAGDNTVSAINTLTNAVTTIKVGSNPFGVAVSPDGLRVYVSNTSDNTVSIISTADNSVITIPAGKGPQSLAVTPDGSRLYILNTGFGEVTVINTADDLITTEIVTDDFSGSPGGIVVSPDGSTVYAAEYLSGTLLVIHTNSTNRFGDATIRFTSGVTGVSLNADGSRLYAAQSSNNNYLSVINTSTNTIIGIAATGNMPFSIGNFVTGAGCSGAPVNVTITINPSPPGIQVSAATGNIFACVGTASAGPAVMQFKVSGNGLTGDINVTAPANFEIASSLGGPYGGSLTLKQAGGLVPVTTIYVRSAATAKAGNINGNVIITSAGLSSVSVSVSGTINQLDIASANPTSQQTVNGKMTSPVTFSGTGNTFTWTNDAPGIGLPANGTGDISAFKAVNTGKTPIIAHLTVISSSSGYAYIGNGSTAGPLTIINTTTNKVVNTINTGSPTYIVVSDDNTRVYVGNYKSGSISVIDVGTNKVINTILINAEPIFLAISPDGKTLYAATDMSSVLVINTANGSIEATIATGLFSFGLIVSPDGSKLYVAVANTSQVLVINTATNQVIHTIVVDQAPNCVLLSPDGSKLYITYGYSNTVAVINTLTYEQIAIFTVYLAPFYTAISPDGSLLYVSSGQYIQKYSTATYQLLSILADIPTGMSFSPDGTKIYTTDSSLGIVNIYNTANDALVATIPVTAGFSDGSFVTRFAACDGPPVNFTIEVDPSPPDTISASGQLTNLTTTYGTPSASIQFQVSGIGLQSGITVTAPTGFEVSSNNKSFSNSIIIGTSGTLASTPVYIRLSAVASAGNYSDSVALSSKGADNNNSELVNGLVNPAPLTITADDKTKIYKENNPVLTVSYKGFVNHEDYQQLTVQPLIVTTATVTSVVGKYPIIASGASAANYVIDYIPGVLTVTPILLPLVIPNTFTPNGDGINDYWHIKNIEEYPLCTVNIFDRYGQKVYSSIGYAVPWDGRYNGGMVPTGTYYYIINLENHSSAIAGYIAVIR